MDGRTLPTRPLMPLGIIACKRLSSHVPKLYGFKTRGPSPNQRYTSLKIVLKPSEKVGPTIALKANGSHPNSKTGTNSLTSWLLLAESQCQRKTYGLKELIKVTFKTMQIRSPMRAGVKGQTPGCLVRQNVPGYEYMGYSRGIDQQEGGSDMGILNSYSLLYYLSMVPR